MRFLTALALTAITSASAFATPLVGQPTDGALGFQPGVTPIMEQVNDFHNILLWIIIPISVFVMGLLGWIIIRYNKKANPVPAKFSHNTLLEVVWTGIPVVILVVISFFSFPLLYMQDTIPSDPDGEIPPAEFTIKAVGYQWYWGYEYPDHGIEEFASTMIADEDLRPDQPRNLAVDQPIVIPVDTTIRLQVVAADVIHNWAMPAFGTKMDAIPGRINEAWFHVTEEGTFYGQCSELCGLRHAFMPIEVHAVSRDVFDRWVEMVAEDPYSEEAYQLIADNSAERMTRLAQLD